MARTSQVVNIDKRTIELSNLEKVLFPCLDRQSKPVFLDVVRSIQQSTEAGISRLQSKYPVYCYLFDCLYMDGHPTINEPLERRREWMADSVKKNTPFRISDSVNDGNELFKAAKRLGLEGIVAKEKNSPYYRGKRSEMWLKIKVRQTMDCIIIGYSKGKGDREPFFGALHLGIYQQNELLYYGKVGTGCSESMLKSVLKELNKMKVIDKPITKNTGVDVETIWIEPKLICEIQYASLTKNNMLREPVFIRLRPDLMVDN